MSDVRLLILDVWFQRSDIRRLMSYVTRPLYDVRHLISDIWCLMLDIWCFILMWDVWCLMSDVWRFLSDVRRLMSEVWRQTTNRSLTRNQTTNIRRLTSDVWHQTTNIGHLISDFWYETSDIREQTCCLISDAWCLMMILRLWVMNNTFLYFTPPCLGESSNFNISKSSIYMQGERDVWKWHNTVNSCLADTSL